MTSVPADQQIPPRTIELRDNGEWWASHPWVGIGRGPTMEAALQDYQEREAQYRNPPRPARRYTSYREVYVLDDDNGYTRWLLRSLGYPEHTPVWRVGFPGSIVRGDEVTDTWADWSIELTGRVVRSTRAAGPLYVSRVRGRARLILQNWIRRAYSTYCPFHIEVARHPKGQDRVTIHGATGIAPGEVSRLYADGLQLLKRVEEVTGRPKGSGTYPNRDAWYQACWAARRTLEADQDFDTKQEGVTRPPSKTKLYTEMLISSSTFFTIQSRWGLPWDENP